MSLKDLTVLVTGGTGSLGNAVIRRIMTGEMGRPRKVIVFSRDELKQHEMRLRWYQDSRVIEDLREFSAKDVLEFRIGDVRLYDTLMPSLTQADVVVNTAALKQVPQCEYFPFEAVRTNIEGPYNLVRGIREHRLPVQKVVTISTDKACKPVNVMGMTKALQERVILSANLECKDTSFMAVRYGNVVASRGSVVPVFQKQIEQGGPVTITSTEMTRFLLTLDQAVDTVFEALREGVRGETLIPQVPSARVADNAQAMIAGRSIEVEMIGIRPGEKIHEILISEEECHRTTERNGYYVIHSILPELASDQIKATRKNEYSSAENLLSADGVRQLLIEQGFVREVPN
ncbi:MAG: polysaccharide biosynthesis protein [Anaerolineae bacterium]